MDEIDRTPEVGNIESVWDIGGDDPFEIFLDEFSFKEYEDPFRTLIDRLKRGIISFLEREGIRESIADEGIIGADDRDHNLIY